MPKKINGLAQVKSYARLGLRVNAIKHLRDLNPGRYGLKEAFDIVSKWTPKATKAKDPEIQARRDARTADALKRDQLTDDLGKALGAYRDHYGHGAAMGFVRGFLNCTVY